VQSVYCYLGYYNVCNLGGEMKEPEKNIPRAIFISIAGIAVLYLAMQTSILSVVPWQEAQNSPFLVSLFIERTFGIHWAALGRSLILVLAFGSIFSATLGYSRVPYAAALDGNFFSIFGRVHPTKRFPYVSLIALGATSAIICLFFDLFSVIRAILAMRCLIQFVGQACGLLLLHRKWKAERWPFRMWFYPVPVLLAIAGWIGIFLSTGMVPIVSSMVAMAIGVTVYMTRARMLSQWPFQSSAEANGIKETSR
jgi:amino acid transporter